MERRGSVSVLLFEGGGGGGSIGKVERRDVDDGEERVDEAVPQRVSCHDFAFERRFMLDRLL